MGQDLVYACSSLIFYHVTGHHHPGLVLDAVCVSGERDFVDVLFYSFFANDHSRVREPSSWVLRRYNPLFFDGI